MTKKEIAKWKRSGIYAVAFSKIWKQSKYVTLSAHCEEVAALVAELLSRSEGESHEEYLQRMRLYGIPQKEA